MILYLDTSAWLKLYVKEVETEAVQFAMGDAEIVAISRVGYAEARAALALLLREKRTTSSEHRRRVVALNVDFDSLLIVDVTDLVVRSAGKLAESHALRGFDAIHLASAAWLTKHYKPVRFLAFDDRLNLAARATGLTIA